MRTPPIHDVRMTFLPPLRSALARRRLRLLPALACCLLSACSRGSLSVASSDQPNVSLSGKFSTVVYNLEDFNNLHIVMIDGPESDPAQAVHVQMHWQPKAGSTPVDDLATNATISYVVFDGPHAGVYRGAGFMFIRNDVGDSVLSAELRNTALRLHDKSDGFSDTIGQATATGGFTARLDDLAAQRLLRAVQIKLHRKLGYPTFVSAPAPAADLARAR
jgi:hypothetical protein